MQETILFTIIIPTYNRCQMLEESLQIAIPQVRRYKDDVSLYVSDNASTDDTQAVVAKYLQGNEDIMSYFRQPENIGGQRNFRHAVKAVNSKYVCLLGDDDVLFPNYVETIVELLKGYPDVGLINCNMMSVNYEHNHARLREVNIKGLSPVVYDSGKTFIYEHLEVPSHISSNVFKRSKFIDSMDSFAIGTYPGYDWFCTLYKSCLESKCIFIGYPLQIEREPLIQRWATDAPWYYIYGLGKMFKELDKDIEGIYSHWINYSHGAGYSILKYLLQIVNSNKVLYRERFEDMRPYMGTSEFEKLFWQNLHHSSKYIEFVNSPLLFTYLHTKRIIKRWVSVF